MQTPKDIQEVELIIENLKWLNRQMIPAISNWQATKPRCSLLGSSKIVKNICEKPGTLNRDIFDPLLKWLYDYILNREGSLAFTGKGLDTFLKKGLRHIHAFIVIAEFFERNPQYFIPDPPISNLTEYVKAQKSQAEYKKFLNVLMSKLIGCNRKLSFLFLDLSRTIRQLPKDLKDIQEYLDQQCLFTRTRLLKIK